MNKYLLVMMCLGCCILVNAQKKNDQAIERRLIEIEDRIAIKNLVDTFSVLADVKNIGRQVLLFTEDAIVESFREGKSTGILNGRKQIGDAFGGFLKLFDIVYHLNGQLTLTLQGDKALGISYCYVTLVGMENGKRTQTNFYVIYHDEYKKKNGQWLIAKRQSDFTYTSKNETQQ
ncbi:MAG: nuclear transport factor 2 family protein [Chitinophagaceae bacterium]